MMKLAITPDQENYTASDAEDVISTKVGGGPPRMRMDLLNSETKIEVQWTLNPAEYQYIRAFYNYIHKGADSFLMDLLLESPTLAEYVVRIIPGTWKLTSVKGTTFKVKCTLSVAPNTDGIDYVALVENYTPEPYVPPPDPVDWGIE